MENEHNIISIDAYRNKEMIDPNDLSAGEYSSLILSNLSHPSIINNPQRTAARLLEFLPGDTIDEEMDTFKARAAELVVDARNLDDYAFSIVMKDEIATAVINVIQSKNGHYRGNEMIVEAARALMNFRAGLVLHHSEVAVTDQELWLSVVHTLGISEKKSR